jgi:5-methylcytosine-specific restriction endonuclease McrA
MPAVKIGNLVFRTKKDAVARYKEILHGAPYNQTLTQNDDAFMRDCVNVHPKIKTWLTDHDGVIVRVYIGDGPKTQFPSRALCVEMRSRLDHDVSITETASHKQCLNGLFGARGCSSQADIEARYVTGKRSREARLAISKDRNAFEAANRRDDGTFECAMCEQIVSTVQVDHKSPLFEEILSDFCKKHPTCKLSEDDPLTKEWQAYHAKVWVPQLLCVGCHTAKSAQEHSDRARKRKVLS